MLIREIVINALSLLGIAKKGVAPADQMEKAERVLKTALKTYSGDDVITAFQKLNVFELEKGETVIGDFVPKRGCRIHDRLDNVSDLVDGRDYAYVDGNWYAVHNVTSTSKAWVPSGPEVCCDTVPDVIVRDMERIVAVKILNEGKWYSLRKTNLAQLEPDDRYAYVANPDGERRERLYTAARGTCRIVYNTSMGLLTMNSNVDLPEPYIELLEASVCVGCARTAEQLARYSAQLAKVEENVTVSNTSERMPYREVD